MTTLHTSSPEHLSPEKRIAEVAKLLAKAIVRLRGLSASLSEDAKNDGNPLAFASERSVNG